MAKPDKKQRRVKGDAYWKLNRYVKQGQEQQEELVAWQQQKAEEATFIDPHTAELITGVYFDLINWNTGAIYADGAEIVAGISQNRRVVGRLSREILAEYQKRMEPIKKLNEEIGEYRDKLAVRLDVWPEQIDWMTGKISTEEFEAEVLGESLDGAASSEDDEPETDTPEE